MSQPDAVTLWRYPNCGQWGGLVLPRDAERDPADVNYATEYRALPAAAYAALVARVEAAEGALGWLREAVDDAEQHAMNTAGDGGYGRWAYQRFMPKWATNARAHIDAIDALRASGTREGE